MRVTLVALVLAAIAAPATAEVTRRCTITYETRTGWSKEETSEISSFTGSELNTIIGSRQYHTFLLYAVLPRENGRVAVIRLEQPVPRAGRTFDGGDFRRYFRSLDETGGEPVTGVANRWRIRAKRAGQFIDARFSSE